MDRPKTRGPYAKTAARRADILRAARESFAEYGYERSTLRDIAARAGISAVGMLHHFSSKEELLMEVVAQRDREERARSAEVMDAGSPHAAGKAFLLDLVRGHQKS